MLVNDRWISTHINRSLFIFNDCPLTAGDRIFLIGNSKKDLPDFD